MTAATSRTNVRDDSGRAPLLIAVAIAAAAAAFFLSIITIAGATAGRMASTMQPRLAGQVTVMVWGEGLESTDAAAARAAEILSSLDGVGRATVQDADDTDATIGSLATGRHFRSDGPRLVSLDGLAKTAPAAANLRNTLAAAHLRTAIDDHRSGRGPLEMRVLVAAGLAAALGIALIGGLFTACVMAGSGMVKATIERFSLMVELGADAAYIGAIVARNFALVAFVGGVFGIVGAGIVLSLPTSASMLWMNVGVMISISPGVRDLFWAVSWPIIAMLISGIGGLFGASRAIVRRERGI